jgi:hypothetical protein
MFDVTIKKDYKIYGSTDLTVYDLIIITGFAPNIGYSATNNIKNAGIPLMIIEYWDFWYSYRMGLLNWDSGDYYGTDTVELINDQHPITNGLDQEVEVYDEPWAVLYGASLNSLSMDTEPLIYSWQSANEAAVIVDDDRKIVATGIYDTTHFTADGWRLFDETLGFVHPSGGLITPSGYSSLEFISFMESKVADAPIVEIGGMSVALVELDAPLVYEGGNPTSQFIELTEMEMAEIDVRPGDETLESTYFRRQYYMLKEEPYDPGGLQHDGGVVVLSYGMTPSLNFWGPYGTGLVLGYESYIDIVGWSNTGVAGGRTGTVLFANPGDGQGEHYSLFEVALPAKLKPSLWPAVLPEPVTTQYSQYITIGNMPVWCVVVGDEWVELGENGWNSITIAGDDNVDTNPVTLRKVNVFHNSMRITPATVLAEPRVLNGANPTRSLAPEISDFQQSIIFNSPSPVLQAAATEYAKGAQSKYPVFSKQDPALDFCVFGGCQGPIWWCSEFAMWALDEGGVVPAGVNPLPRASTIDIDFGLKEVRQWFVTNVPDQFAWFADDADPAGGGPNDDEWGCLGDQPPVGQPTCSGFNVIGAGDYVGKRQCAGPSCDKGTINPDTGFHEGMGGHSMIAIGWTDFNLTAVGPAYFQKNRDWNWLLVIEGNAGGTFAPSSGMTRVVTTRKKVCRKNGVANDCYLVLADANPQNGLNSFQNDGFLEGDFFGDMN